ncbi:hypothetical protein APE02nite_10320 [Alkalibacterium pelagium]|nr:hypothetical protein APE02nite_10320 [Alkalibacterium pelagium]
MKNNNKMAIMDYLNMYHMKYSIYSIKSAPNKLSIQLLVGGGSVVKSFGKV